MQSNGGPSVKAGLNDGDQVMAYLGAHELRQVTASGRLSARDDDVSTATPHGDTLTSCGSYSDAWEQFIP